MKHNPHKTLEFITVLSILAIIAKIVATALLIWLTIYACTSISASVKSNDSTIMREFGQVISETKSEFDQGLKEGK